VQGISSMDFPLQLFPDPAGAGLLQALDLDWVPWIKFYMTNNNHSIKSCSNKKNYQLKNNLPGPQVTEQSLIVFQVPHWPFTGPLIKKYKTSIKMILNKNY
jgi:hypothetical protein